MYLLDTDTVSLLLRGNEQIAAHVRRTPPEHIWISGIVVEQMMQGSLAVINQQRSRPGGRMNEAYVRLIQLVKQLAKFNMLPYDEAAERLFQSFHARTKRVGSQDCRIAASAIALNYIVVTCNGKDFSQIPNVQFEDWTLEDSVENR